MLQSEINFILLMLQSEINFIIFMLQSASRLHPMLHHMCAAINKHLQPMYVAVRK